MKKHLIFEKLEGYPNLTWAEFLPPWAFLDFFCKISTPDVQLALPIPLCAIVRRRGKAHHCGGSGNGLL